MDESNFLAVECHSRESTTQDTKITKELLFISEPFVVKSGRRITVSFDS